LELHRTGRMRNSHEAACVTVHLKNVFVPSSYLRDFVVSCG
jgi:hypothetical protein